MRFPATEQLHLPCRFERVVEGRQHHDGRRYLPLIVLGLPAGDGAGVDGARELVVVDRHHVVDLAGAGRAGVARLVFLLSSIQVQTAPFRRALVAEAGMPAGRPSSAPLALGQVVEVLTWEAEQSHLPYESLYTELLLDVGIGVVGVRTSATAASLSQSLGATRLAPGDWIEVRRSRIDILEFKI